ncbi:N-acetyltransferase [Streptomyces sp. RerS4]|uniref:GNAT family N-acetyltransferase n=1 Tax=Streptomyces sp. RerS4 TaxID=2942449 RepID=UPI00201C512A|nr:N-acetyltransferase [Streptomyces sp. RerS4]UQX04676.1 N-acetyltransferase [Streptomyces sp. RerS4]
MLIRREAPADLAAVRALTTATSHKPHPQDTVEARLRDALRSSEAWIPALSLVAEDETGTLVGHALCSWGRIGAARVPDISLLGVLPEHRRRGVGSALVHASLAASDALDAPLIVVLGDPAFYSRFGFRPSTDLGIVGPERGWGDFFQVRTLAAYQPSVHGEFVYSEAVRSCS